MDIWRKKCGEEYIVMAKDVFNTHEALLAKTSYRTLRKTLAELFHGFGVSCFIVFRPGE